MAALYVAGPGRQPHFIFDRGAARVEKEKDRQHLQDIKRLIVQCLNPVNPVDPVDPVGKTALSPRPRDALKMTRMASSGCGTKF